MSVKKENNYYESVGRRKTAIARVRIFKNEEFLVAKKNFFMVNEKTADEYFGHGDFLKTISFPLELSSVFGFEILVKVCGGSKKGQAQAVQLALSRALIKFNIDHERVLKDNNCLKRDSRKKERKKAGLKKARRAPQWAKR